MASSYSIILIGLGMFSFWILAATTIILGIQMGVEGYPTRSDFRELFGGNYDNLNSLSALMMILVGGLGSIIGVTISIVGTIKWIFERSRHIQHSPEKKPVSIFWQGICTLFPGFDLWAFYRVKKLHFGILIDGIFYVTVFGKLFAIIPDIGNQILLNIFGQLLILGFLLYWSREWNKELSGQTSKEDTVIFTG